MNTSDLVSIGSRPLLPTSKTTYDREAKDVLLAKLAASFSRPAPVNYQKYETYQFEFPGDRTYERYLSNRTLLP